MNKEDLLWYLKQEKSAYDELIRSVENYPFRDKNRSVYAYADVLAIKYHSAIVNAKNCEIKDYAERKAWNYAKAIKSTAAYMKKISKNMENEEKNTVVNTYRNLRNQIFA